MHLFHSTADALLEEGASTLGYTIAGIIAIFGTDILKTWQKRRRHKPMRESSEMDREIYRLLTEARVKLNADRVYVVRYANGQFFEDGGPVMRRIRTHESCHPNFATQTTSWDHVLTSLVPDEITLCLEPGPSFRAVDNLPDGTFKRMLQHNGVTAVARCGMRRGAKAGLIGFVGADFSHTEQPANIDLLVELAGVVEVTMARYA